MNKILIAVLVVLVLCFAMYNRSFPDEGFRSGRYASSKVGGTFDKSSPYYSKVVKNNFADAPRGLLQQQRVAGERSRANPRYLSEAALANPRYLSEGALANPRYLSEAARVNPRYLSEGALANPRYLSEGARENPRYLSEAARGNPRYLSEGALANPRYSREPAFARPFMRSESVGAAQMMNQKRVTLDRASAEIDPDRMERAPPGVPPMNGFNRPVNTPPAKDSVRWQALEQINMQNQPMVYQTGAPVVYQQPIYYPAGTPGTVVVYNQQAVPVVNSTIQESGEQQIGYLVNYLDQMYLPLYRIALEDPSIGIFYTRTNDQAQAVLPIYFNGANCTDPSGCVNLINRDKVYIPQFDRTFHVSV